MEAAAHHHLSKIEKAVRESIAALLFLTTVVVLAMHYSALPPRIPSQFNGGGDAHGFGNKNQLWLMVFIQAWFYVLMSLFNLMPATSTVNQNSSMSPDARAKLLSVAKVFMGWFKVTIMAVILIWIASIVT